jgi:Mrp family chromosome partitioning ATPase
VVGGEKAATVSPQEQRIGVGSVAPGTAWTDLQHLGSRTVLVVRAGHGSAAWLHTVARQLADQHIPVIGVVLIDPDPRDRTDGTLWDGSANALRGRSERPTWQNGGGTSHAVQAAGEGRRLTERQPIRAARVPDNDQEVR